ncbi:MAG: hypothetical protein ACTSWX_14240 [Promethearchaeota archaeon]
MNKKKLEKINDEMKENFDEIDSKLNGYYKERKEKDIKQKTNEKPEIIPGLNQFFQKTRDSFLKIQDDLNANIDKLLNESLERQKLRQQKRLERLNEQKEKQKILSERQKIRQQRIIDRWERKRQRMNLYYTQQEELLDQRFEHIQKNIDGKSEFEREKLQNSLKKTRKKWTKSIRRQRNLESFLNSLNRWSWRQQLRFLLIIIPLLVIFIIVFKIIQPFIM